MRRRDHLERAVLDALWDTPDGLTGAELVTVLTDRSLALTTVLTVLERLRGKSLVARRQDGRAFRYTAVQSREDLAADAMLAALRDSQDHSLALSRFVDGVSTADVEALRRALRSATATRRKRASGEQ